MLVVAESTTGFSGVYLAKPGRPRPFQVVVSRKGYPNLTLRDPDPDPNPNPDPNPEPDPDQ